MKKARYILSLCLFLVIFYSCKNEAKEIESTKIELGHYLFFDKNISINHTKSCASCHAPELAFTDGYRRSITSLGENVLHNAPSLINISEHHYFDWANIKATTLKEQIKRPLHGKTPVELGFDQHEKDFSDYVSKNDFYQKLFKKAFPTDKNFGTKEQVENAIVAYEMTLNSHNSKFDKYINGDENALTMSELNGLKLFSSDKLNCSKCHVPPSFTLTTKTNDISKIYRNIGLYNINNQNVYPSNDLGIFTQTKDSNDIGKFKIPSLRNVLISAPYMHDGSVNTIEEVIDVYANGGRNNTTGIYIGDGRINTHKDALIKGFTISQEEKNDLLHFLNTLTDSTIFTNPNFQNPFQNNSSSY